MIDPTAFTRAAAALTAAGLLVFVGWRASRPDDEPPAAAETLAETVVDFEPLSSWPAGALAGTKPGVLSAQPIQPDGCIEAAPQAEVTLQLTAAVALWIFADPADKVTAEWRDDQGSLSFEIPSNHFEHQFTPGRVTLSAIAPVDPTTLVIRSTPGPVRVCGIGTKVG